MKTPCSRMRYEEHQGQLATVRNMERAQFYIDSQLESSEQDDSLDKTLDARSLSTNTSKLDPMQLSMQNLSLLQNKFTRTDPLLWRYHPHYKFPPEEGESMLCRKKASLWSQPSALSFNISFSGFSIDDSAPIEPLFFSIEIQGIFRISL